MSEQIVRTQLGPLGSLSWAEQTQGRLTFRDRLSLLAGALTGLHEGFRLRRSARRHGLHEGPLARFEPPETPIVQAARAYLIEHSHVSMVNHCFRTAFWTLCVLEQQGGFSAQEQETAWVAALLHDVGLEVEPRVGDFTLGGVRILSELARDVGWSEEQEHAASEAIVSNLSTHVDASRLGRVAWAMNVGGVGELGIAPHRALMSPHSIAELERLYPRDGFRATALRLIQQEAAHVPDGRFAFFQLGFYLLMR